MDSVLCFGFAFLLQGILIAAIINYFTSLSHKRDDGEITETEKWLQGLLSTPLQPALEAVLSKDPVGTRVLLSISVVVSGLVSMALTSGVWAIILIATIALAGIWLSVYGDY